LAHLSAFNLSLVMRQRLGAGTPRELNNKATRLIVRILRFLAGQNRPKSVAEPRTYPVLASPGMPRNRDPMPNDLEFTYLHDGLPAVLCIRLEPMQKVTHRRRAHEGLRPVGSSQRRDFQRLSHGPRQKIGEVTRRLFGFRSYTAMGPLSHAWMIP